jgi:glycosyltransferase involved in cell wall biosynthesis
VRIAHLILSLTGGGAERQLSYLAASLAAAGHDTHVGFVFPGVNAERLAKTGCSLHELRAARAWHPLLAAEAAALLRRVKPDVVQTWLTHMDVVSGAAAFLLGIPWVMSERSSRDYYPPTLLNRARRAAGHRATMIVPNSGGGAEHWISSGADPSRIEVVPNFVPVREIEAAPAVDDERLADGDELILHLGRLSPEKNVGVLAHVLQIVVAKRPRARLVFCGEGPLRDGLASQFAARGLLGRVVFAGFVADVASWLKRASVALTVSPCEGRPNALLEAIAAGVPLIVSDIPAHRAVLPADAACFTAGGDPKAIAAAVVHALSDPEAAGRRALRARAALADHSLEEIRDAYLRIYARAIALAGPTASR